MELNAFAEGIKKLDKWFKKNLTEDQVSMFFAKVSFIPAIPFQDMVDEYTTVRKPQPSNFPTPQDIINDWYKWRTAHPQHVTQEVPRTDCPDCSGKGVLWFKYINEKTGMEYEAMVICAACDNHVRHFGSNSSIPKVYRGSLSLKTEVIDIWPHGQA